MKMKYSKQWLMQIFFPGTYSITIEEYCLVIESLYIAILWWSLVNFLSLNEPQPQPQA